MELKGITLKGRSRSEMVMQHVTIMSYNKKMDDDIIISDSVTVPSHRFPFALWTVVKIFGCESHHLPENREDVGD